MDRTEMHWLIEEAAHKLRKRITTRYHGDALDRLERMLEQYAFKDVPLRDAVVALLRRQVRKRARYIEQLHAEIRRLRGDVLRGCPSPHDDVFMQDEP